MKRIISLLFLACLVLASCDYTVIDNESSQQVSVTEAPDGYEYVINTSTGKYHTQYCSYVADIKEESKVVSSDISFYTKRGYSPCSSCILR